MAELQFLTGEMHKAQNRYAKKAGLSLCTLLNYTVEGLKLGI